MKRRPYCVGGMNARREKQCTDWENVWGLPLASAFPICSRGRCLRRGRDAASKPLATYARQQAWQQTSGCRENSGRSRRRWGHCMRQGASLHKRTRRGRRLRGLSWSWQRASRMRRGVRAFWLGHRFTPCCSTPGTSTLANLYKTVYSKTMQNTDKLEYQRDEHRVHLIVYHLIWCPRRRKAVLVGEIRERCQQIIEEKCKEKGWTILTLAIQPDHIYLFVRV